MTPLVSIIVPCFGVEKYLNQCLESLVNQTLKNIEIILVDDESPDNVPMMCENWKRKDSRIRVIHKKNGGLGLARNSGLSLAQGDYVAFLDSDDFVDNHMYETLYTLAKKENADACYCGYSYYDGVTIKDITEGFTEDKVFEGHHDVDNFLFSMIGLPTSYANDTLINMCVWRAIYRRDIIKDHQISFVSERLVASEDVTFHASFLPYAQKVCFTTAHLYRYRFNPNSISHSYPEWKRQSLLESCFVLKDIFEQHYTKNYYITCYRRHLFRNLKTMVRKEAQRPVSLKQRKLDILKKLCNPIFDELFNREFHAEALPFTQQIVYYLCKYKCVYILIFLIRVMRK